MKYDLFLLDADDTIFDFSACSRNALRRAMAECSIPYAEGDHALYSEINGKLWQALEKKEITHDELFELRFRRFLEGKGCPQMAERLNTAYVARLSEEAVLLDGAEEFLRLLSGMGRVFIVTNGTASVQRGRFRIFDIARYAEKIFISEEMGVYKPDRAYFDRVASEIDGFDSARAIVIGDGLTSDMLLAKNGGVDSVWFTPSGKEATGVTPTCIARSYDEILRFLRQA